MSTCFKKNAILLMRRRRMMMMIIGKHDETIPPTLKP
jgi:hypothetical protein